MTSHDLYAIHIELCRLTTRKIILPHQTFFHLSDFETGLSAVLALLPNDFLAKERPEEIRNASKSSNQFKSKSNQIKSNQIKKL